jgi:uridine kinase
MSGGAPAADRAQPRPVSSWALSLIARMSSSHPQQRFVVVVSGTSGAGKTTVVRRAATALGEAVALHFDDYRAVSTYPPDLRAWLDGGADPNAWQTPRLSADLRALRRGQAITLPGRSVWRIDDHHPRGHAVPVSEGPAGGHRLESRRYVVVEEPFGRTRAELAPLVDFVAHLDVPLEVALARQLLRATTDEAPHHDSGWLRDHLLTVLPAYLTVWRDCYVAAARAARQACDLCLDGLQPLDVVVGQLVDAIRVAEARGTPANPRHDRRSAAG